MTLHVSIVNWNTRESLRRCLRSLQPALAGVDALVSVVDNASGDQSAEMVAAEFPDVRLLALDDNLGFAGGNNAAIEGVQARYVLILNPDVEVTESGVRELISFMEETPDAAAVAPLLVGRDGAVHGGYFRRFPTRLQIALFWTRLARISEAIPPLRRRVLEHRVSGSDPIRVEQLPGAAMLVRGEAFEQIGLMDPDYFIWFEDVDWCYRARLQNAALYALPSVRFAHEGGASFASWEMDGRTHQFNRAFFRFLCKHRLTTLCRFALPVIGGDLQLREWLSRSRGTKNGPGLAATRREIRTIVESYRSGQTVRFEDAGFQRQSQS